MGLGPAHPENDPKSHIRVEPKKPLKPYRSEAERRAVTQRNIQIGISLVTACASILTLLRVFGIL